MGYREELGVFVSSLFHNRPNETDVQDSIKTLRLIEDIKRATIGTYDTDADADLLKIDA